MLSSLTAALAVSVAVFAAVNVAHVLGHLLAARWFGITIDRLSLGVGPTLWRRSIGGLPFRVAALPVGLVVRLRRPFSRSEPASWPSADPRDFRNKSLLVRLAVICIAPATTLALGYGAALHESGIPRPRPTEAPVVSVVPKLPAARAGLGTGDRVLRVDGRDVRTWTEVKRLISSSGGRALRIDAVHGSGPVSFHVQPVKDGWSERWVVGLAPGVELYRPARAGRFGAAAATVWQTLSFQIRGLWTLSVGTRLREVGGPLVLVAPSADPAMEHAAERYRSARSLTVIILGYFFLCMLPFAPYLDGRRLLFLGIEAIARRPLHPRYEQRYNQIAVLASLALIVAVTISDVLR